MWWLSAYYGLRHALGFDTQGSMSYAFTSGPGPFLEGLFSTVAIVASAVAFYHRWSCRYSWWCFRHGHHALTDPDTAETRHYCHVHHPGVKRKHWTRDHIEDVWRRHLEHRARQAGL